MVAVQKDLMEMKVTELKEELEAREEAKSGSKAPGFGAACTPRLCGHI